MIHIVFQEADEAVMQKAMELDPGLAGPVLRLTEDYSLGPVAGLEPSFAGLEPGVALGDNPGEVWLWIAQNPRDVCGYYALLEVLKPFAGGVQVLFLNNLPFLNEKGSVFYPTRLSEIPPSEFRKAKKLARPVTASEFELDADEWRRRCEENAPVRTLEGAKKIVDKDATYYDKELLSNLGSNWQKFSRVLANTVHRMKVRTSEEFLASRLRELAASGVLQASGDTAKGWAACEIKLAGVTETAGES